MKFYFPPIYSIRKKDNRRNDIVQLLLPARSDVEINLEKIDGYGYLLEEQGNHEKTLLITSPLKSVDEYEKVIKISNVDLEADIEKVAGITDLKIKEWIKHPSLGQVPDENVDLKARAKRVTNSWKECFRFLEEVKDKNGEIKKYGLRSPQLGAVYATLAYWKVTHETATIVLPTGIGKTETMLSILVKSQCKKVLVVVPTDALRDQISEKFITLGLLKHFGIVLLEASYPIVGVVKHKFKSLEEVDNLFETCNVIVTTMNIAAQSKPIIQKRFAFHCSHLFIDEAHHTEAPTWKEFKKNFAEKRILQFTATPFRNDGKNIDGKIIFRYPLKQAQKDGYYAPINFFPVIQYNPEKYDEMIAKKAFERLLADIKEGYSHHILMARVNSIKRAEEVFKIYDTMWANGKYPEEFEKIFGKDPGKYPEEFKKIFGKDPKEFKNTFKPVKIHTGIKKITDRKEIRDKIFNKEAKIIICVDMLGEGFDLPELKIAAFHDIRRSLPITLQLIGRFTRSKTRTVGPASVIANIADVEVIGEIEELYKQDSEWDLLIPEMNRAIIKEEIELWEIVKNFKGFPGRIPIQHLCPAMSTVIYKTNTDEWIPENFYKGFNNPGLLRILYDVNHEKRILVIVVGQETPLSWGKIKDSSDWNWNLHIVFWDAEHRLLFIHSSNTNSYL